MPSDRRAAGLDAGHVVRTLRSAGVTRGSLLSLALAPDGLGLAAGGACWPLEGDTGTGVEIVRRVATELAPRWVWWSAAVTAGPAVLAGVRLVGCWDLAAVHRLLVGGSRDDPARVWATARGLPETGLPRSGQLNLLDLPTAPWPVGDPEDPVRPDGYLRPEWVTGPGSGQRAARWAELALQVQAEQERRLRAERPDPRLAPTAPPLAVLTAWSESAAALLCVELAAAGLPLDRTVAEALVARHAGPRPADAAAASTQRARRDEDVLRHLSHQHLSGGQRPPDLRNPAQVRALLRSIGIDVPDTRSGRLERLRDVHPVVPALLAWRRSERIATTYGYAWLDRHVGADGRLRGGWAASDGAAGRMTAQAGLHNLPAELRAAVVAEPGHLFVRADLGQIEPRVLAAVSGDTALLQATHEPDLYAPIAARLGCDRPTAKVAVLAAMYGQTSGTAGEALRGLERAYPVAMRYLTSAATRGAAGTAVQTYGGRRVPMWGVGGTATEAPGIAAARGRFARNALVQGAAAELFKMWAVTVRAGLPDLASRRPGDMASGTIVLCLHDELLVHVAAEQTDAVSALLVRSLESSAARWAAGSAVRFVADVAVIRRWSDVVKGLAR